MLSQQRQDGVITQHSRPSSYQNLTPKEIEQIKEMQKWEQIRRQRRAENGIPEPGMKSLVSAVLVFPKCVGQANAG
jgi:hypothetical protein